MKFGKYISSHVCTAKNSSVGAALCIFILNLPACYNHATDIRHHESATNVFFVNENESFGYPLKRFLHPSVSPDDKWVTYHRTSGVDWRDTVWKKIYYSRVGKFEDKVVPKPMIPKGGRIKSVGGIEEWSPDGRYFVYHAEIEFKKGGSENKLVVIDFGGNRPRLVESVECTSYPDVYFIGKDTYIYTDGTWLIRKRIGDLPQKAVKFKKRPDTFQVGSNGNVIYRYGLDELYLTNFINPSDKRLSPHHSYTLSPNGRYVVLYTNQFYTKVAGRRDDQLAVLVDLEKEKTIYTFIIKKNKHVSWSSDGHKIAFVGEDIAKFEKRKIPAANSFHHLVVVDIETMDIRAYHDSQSDHIVWFSDGKRILYSQESNFRFVVRNIETNAIDGIINNVRENGIWITPSGKTLYWNSCLDIDEECFYLIQNPFDFNN